MTKVFTDITMSLDGFIAGPNDGPELPLGAGGERLHQWVYELSSWRERQGVEGGVASRDSEMVDETFNRTGATILGRNMFNNGEEPWGESPPFQMPVFVLTHHAREPDVRQGGTTFTFVTDGIQSALHQAKTAAGDKDVHVGGGANIVQQFIRAGLLNEIQVHIAPVFLGTGVRLFDHLGTDQIELENTRVIESPAATHLRYLFVR